MTKLTNAQRILKALASGPKTQINLKRETKIKNIYQVDTFINFLWMSLKKGLKICNALRFTFIEVLLNLRKVFFPKGDRGMVEYKTILVLGNLGVRHFPGNTDKPYDASVAIC